MALHGNPAWIKEVNDWIAKYMKGGTTEYAKFLEREHYYRGLKLEELSKPHAEGRHPFTVGFSAAGDCSRIPQLAALGYEQTHSAGTKMTFHLGHTCEATIYALMEAVGTWDIEATQNELSIPGDYPFPLAQTRSDGTVVRKDTRIRYAFSGKTDDMKMSIPGFKGKPAKRKGFTALPLDGVKSNYTVQSWLECYAAKPRLDNALVFVLSKGFIPAFETDDDIMKEMGSAVVWMCAVEAQHDVVENSILPSMRNRQRELVAKVAGDGRFWDKEIMGYRPADPRVDNKKVNGHAWDRCKWSTGECSMREACLAEYAKRAGKVA